MILFTILYYTFLLLALFIASLVVRFLRTNRKQTYYQNQGVVFSGTPMHSAFSDMPGAIKIIKAGSPSAYPTRDLL